MEGFDHIINRFNRLKRYIEHDAPIIMGTEAVKHFQQSFYDEGFTDGHLVKWKPSKRKQSNSQWYGFLYGARTPLPNSHPRRKDAKRKYKARKSNPITNYSPAATKWKTLTGNTGDLKESIKFKKNFHGVTVYSELPYAKVHNEGGYVKVFGKKRIRLPKRQFIGKSAKLENKLRYMITKDIRNLLK